MNVLMIAHTFPPFGTVGGSIRLVKYLKYLNIIQDRWEPTVITITDKIDLLFLNKNSTFNLTEIPENLRIIKTETAEFTSFFNLNTTLGKFCRKFFLLFTKPFQKYVLIPDGAILWGRFLMPAAEKELSNKKYSILYATAPPFSVLYQSAKIKKKTGIPLVLDIKDDWIDKERFRGVKKLRKNIELKMERECINAADKIITVTPKSYEAFIRRYPQHYKKFTMIPNGCDVNEYRELWSSPIKKYSTFTMVHAGVFSFRRDFSCLFSAIKNLIEKYSEIRANFEFRIIGRIPSDQQKAIKKAGIQNFIKAEGYKPRKEYLRLLAKSHLPVVINYDIPTLIPGKIYEYWGSRNRIMLLDSQYSAAAELVKKYNLGDIVSPDNIQGIEKIIKDTWTKFNNGESTKLDTSGLEFFDRKYLTEKLINVFDEVQLKK